MKRRSRLWQGRRRSRAQAPHKHPQAPARPRRQRSRKRQETANALQASISCFRSFSLTFPQSHTESCPPPPPLGLWRARRAWAATLGSRVPWAPADGDKARTRSRSSGAWPWLGLSRQLLHLHGPRHDLRGKCHAPAQTLIVTLPHTKRASSMQASSSWKCTDCSKDPHPPAPLLCVFVFELGQAILDSHRRHPHRQDARKAPEDIASEASDKLFDSGSVSPSAKKLAAARQGIVEVSLCTPASFSGTASCRGAFWHTPGQGRTSERWLGEVRRGREHLPLRIHKDSKHKRASE